MLVLVLVAVLVRPRKTAYGVVLGRYGTLTITYRQYSANRLLTRIGRFDARAS